MPRVQKTWNKDQVRMESLHATAVCAGLYGWSLLKEKQNMIKQNKKLSKDHELKTQAQGKKSQSSVNGVTGYE